VAEKFHPRDKLFFYNLETKLIHPGKPDSEI